MADDVPDYLCLSVVLDDRTVDLQAGSHDQRDLWIRALRVRLPYSESPALQV
jgi:hypothetical protein